MIVDATALHAFFVRGADRHWAIAGVFDLTRGEEWLVSPFSVAELEQMIRPEFGEDGWQAVVEELSGGAWRFAAVDPAHLKAVARLGELPLPVASVLALAEERGAEILSLRPEHGARGPLDG